VRAIAGIGTRRSEGDVSADAFHVDLWRAALDRQPAADALDVQRLAIDPADASVGADQSDAQRHAGRQLDDEVAVRARTVVSEPAVVLVRIHAQLQVLRIAVDHEARPGAKFAAQRRLLGFAGTDRDAARTLWISTVASLAMCHELLSACAPLSALIVVLCGGLGVAANAGAANGEASAAASSQVRRLRRIGR
jgi:hypothetical protein